MLSALIITFSYFWQIIKAWWWLPLPFFLWRPFLFLWLWWRTEKFFLPKQKFILLEIKIPEESLKPIRAMETLMSGLWQSFYDPPNFWEEWWDGKCLLGLSFETVSLGGEVHFYIRISESQRDILESCIYSQYPEAEITIAQDYTKNIPQDIPNKDWDFWGADYRLAKVDPYPIKTYTQFETESEKEEEKRIDPLAMLLEALAKVKPGEQFWLQIQVTPIAQKYAASFMKEAAAIIKKTTQRKESAKPKSMTQEIMEILFHGQSKKESSSSEELFPPVRMKLTPGEEEILKAVEKKMSKPLFLTSIRFIWLGKKDVWFKGNLRFGLAFFGHYNTQNLNSLFPLGKTISKVYSRPPFNILDKRRVYLRKRRMIRFYRDRWRPLFPRNGDWETGTFVLNTEELASIYHFPSRLVAPAPGAPRVKAKKKAPPPELPVG